MDNKKTETTETSVKNSKPIVHFDKYPETVEELEKRYPGWSGKERYDIDINYYLHGQTIKVKL